MTEKTRYSTVQIVLHWTVALLVVGQYVFNGPISEAWDTLSRGMPVSFNPLILAHVAGGVLILALVVWRLVLRLSKEVPSPRENEPAILRFAAGVAHWALYGLLIAMAGSGLVAWFGSVETAARAHGAMKVALMALIVIHALAVVFHHLVLKSPILKRMIPK